MPTVLAKVLLFVGALWPFAFIYGLYNAFEGKIIMSILYLSGFVIGVVATGMYLKIVQSLNPISVKIESVEGIPEQPVIYLATYAIPLVGLLTEELAQNLLLILFFLTMAFFYVRNTLVHINPILHYMYKKVYKVGTAGGYTVTLLSSRTVKPGDTILMIKISESLRIAKQPANRRVESGNRTRRDFADRTNPRL